MIFTRSKKFHVSMGNYEWLEFGAEVTLDSAEFPHMKFPAEDLPIRAEEILNEMLAQDIEESSAITAERDSFIHLYKKEQ